MALERGWGEATEEERGQVPPDWMWWRGPGSGGLHQGVRVRAAGGRVAAEARVARRRYRLHARHAPPPQPHDPLPGSPPLAQPLEPSSVAQHHHTRCHGAAASGQILRCLLTTARRPGSIHGNW
jgi:hypothetical protein